MAIEIGAQLYTVRNQMNEGEDAIREGLQKIAEMGYTTVQFSGVQADVGFFRAECDKNGLSVSATHYPLERMQNEFDAVVAEHETLGCKNIGIGSMPHEFRTDADGYHTFARQAQELAKKLRDRGLTLFYHNHRFEFERFGDRTGMEILLEEAPDLMFMPDVYWFSAAGVNPVNALRKLSGRMVAVHLKDMTVRKDQSIMAEVGYGNLDMPAIIETAKACGVDIFLVEQDECERDPYESLAMSAGYLKTVL